MGERKTKQAAVTPKSRGDWGEAQVAEFLRMQGYVVLISKYRCRFGEIDLIARDGDILCFVEVKLRRCTDFGLPREYVTAAKQRKLRIAAECYLSTHDPDARCRFDVAEVYPAGDNTSAPRIEYIENAF